jgi:hypothetical protein
MPKTAKHSITLLIPATSGRILLVLRPTDDDTLPGLWSLPAITTAPGEDEAEAIRRAGRDKLGVELLPGGLIGEAERDSDHQTQRIRGHEATIVSGSASVPQHGPGTQYVDWRWGTPEDLKSAARAGSLGCQIALRARDVPW